MTVAFPALDNYHSTGHNPINIQRNEKEVRDIFDTKPFIAGFAVNSGTPARSGVRALSR